MSIHTVFQWSVRPEDQDSCEAALALIADHIRRDHPEILSTTLYRQWTGPQPRRGYTWLEEYESLTQIDNATSTPNCLEVWKPVEAMAHAGTWTTSVWFDGPDATKFRRHAT